MITHYIAIAFGFAGLLFAIGGLIFFTFFDYGTRRSPELRAIMKKLEESKAERDKEKEQP